MVLSDTGAFDTIEVARQRHTVQGGGEGATQATSLCGVPPIGTKPARMRPRVRKSSPRSSTSCVATDPRASSPTRATSGTSRPRKGLRG